MNRKKYMTVTAFASCLFLLFTSGIIRHDVPEIAYLKLAGEKQFNGVGQVAVDSSSGGSCVLIGERFVLTAAHVLVVSDYRQDTINFNGQKMVSFSPYNNRSADAHQVRISINGRQYAAKRITMHPNYFISEQNTSYDIAIIELDRPCTAAKPTSINTAPDELSSNVVGVGFGVSGIADQPETVAPYDKKIAGENVVDSIGGLVHLGNATLLYCDFDHPTLGGCNKMGSSTPRPLEYICSGGDSGGGLFRQKGGQWQLVGICSGSNTDIDQLLKTGYYCQVMAWTRVSAFQDWIADNTK